MEINTTPQLEGQLERLRSENPGILAVLVCCEFSDTVTSAFREQGHFAVSCDLRPSENPDAIHIKGDCLAAITSYKWDIIIMHPPCTALAVSGNRWYGRGMVNHDKRLEAIDWTMKLWETATSNCDYVAMENPVGVIPIQATQYIHPYYFGHPEMKKTGLWLHGLPKLMPTVNVEDMEAYIAQLPVAMRQRVWYMSPSKDREKERSRFYWGVAVAMACQWGTYVTRQEENYD